MSLKEMMRDESINKWITSDLHFWHENVIKFCPRTRPFKSAEHMNEMLIQEWNEKVQPNDIIFFLGDFSFKGREATEAILQRLNGYKIMVLGNHDKKLEQLYKRYFDIVVEYLEVSYKGTKICMMHFPIACWNIAGRGSIMLHGHTHGSYQGTGRTIDVGYDNLGEIASLDYVFNKMMKKDIEVLDHH